YHFSVEAGDGEDQWTNGEGPGRYVTTSSGAGDDPPTWPAGSSITATDIQREQVTIAWTPAQDDVGVTAYAVYQDHYLVGTTTNLSYTYTGLSAGTQYHFSVEAGDGEDQWTNGQGPGRYVSTTSGFVDTGGTTFAGDIDWLAAQGITKGCNPPVNDRFCPNDYVTRGQMAAFLVRALGYTDNGGGDLFTDDNGSVFEDAIDKLGTAGVTKGCNPPMNDRFCPHSYVTRGQMAAFLRRALG
ncbi:MAG: S-layer homology domain-containing protein, partial [Acidimicrobiia bacterium]|nr:S-layer homology domain-containing protein [Acidimicrobiia bacterium]